MISLRVIARLLEYPDAELWQQQQAMLEALEQADELPLQQSAQLLQFIADFYRGDLLDRQARYSDLFDRGRALSLLLFEHVHGESRDRGQAMVDLLAQYREVGLELDCRELPDFLPLYLEYLTLRDPLTVRDGLRDIAPILTLLAERLRQRDSEYALLPDLLLTLAAFEPARESVAAKVAEEERDDTPQALDAVWEEEQVRFLADAGCAPAQQTGHQRRFVDAVAPHYLNLDASRAKGDC
ncbi:nitrate reductase molybdenum cofactor assembly chaperone [Dickeya solani]|uniref:Nitrate reductase molybdenum cofactor assembly chaperone n=2 Tax=Dickeya solani TaxID=1089444 RepID=A0AAP1XLG6_9GAMM|nr:nitrate reductase molybdenum cofactor assembly chaperone [Dickeya solani]ANE77591.1 nitrate reductase [Dickeya solani IPO 2222]AUC40930.1 Respiratory nitrate reductase delta chain [Dickeya solani RNS 08.23.3.1.A]AUH06999.1 nitrate reductase molybdenum cofactor assembly chaperone [Dickeya solani D s0432-1]AUH11051.1 nitrate reductase molybdenum cofactor assembly chaperone [Dickeya solani]AYQ48210.1 Nitrate reductase molybdenum cofactor assembly chaperone NarJ [Dickeya solani]